MSGYGPNPERRGSGGCAAVLAVACLLAALAAGAILAAVVLL